MFTYICLSIFVYMNMYICIHIHIYTCICIYVYMHIHIPTCILCICAYISVHIHISTHTYIYTYTIGKLLDFYWLYFLCFLYFHSLYLFTLFPLFFPVTLLALCRHQSLKKTTCWAFGADLYSLTLCGADLYSLTLCGADLYSLTLCGADLYSLTLCGADLYSLTTFPPIARPSYCTEKQKTTSQKNIGHLLPLGCGSVFSHPAYCGIRERILPSYYILTLSWSRTVFSHPSALILYFHTQRLLPSYYILTPCLLCNISHTLCILQ